MNLKELRDTIQSATQPEFRGRLIAKGQARSIIWREGVLLQDSPNFSPSLSHELLTYGASLLSLGIRLKEQGNKEYDEAIYISAFERAGDAIESVISNGDPNQHHRNFYQLLSACSYHLAGLSARAYSTLYSKTSQEKLPPMQQSIGLLILRSLNKLENHIASWRLEGKAEDANLAAKLQKWPDNPEEFQEEDEDFLFSILDITLTDNFYSGIGLFISALETGKRHFIDQSLASLEKGFEEASKFNLVHQWWCYRLAMHIIRDLWDASYHAVLPIDLPSGDEGSWAIQRKLFIASLYREKISQIEFWPSQLKGARRALSSNDNLVISMPTSAGKTRIAEICMLRCLSEAKRVVYITPLRALSAQMESGFNNLFGPLGKKVSTLYGSMVSTGLQGQIFKNSDIVVTTPEKLDFSLRSEPSILNDVGLIILDEGHMIGPDEREVRYEVLVQKLLRRSDASNRRIVCLSAVLPDGEKLDHFVNWIGQSDQSHPVKSKWRPTRVRFGEVTWSGNYARLDIEMGKEKSFVPRFFESKTPTPTKTRRRKPFPNDHKELVLATAWKLLEDNHSVLVYCPKRKTVESLADAIVDLEKRGLINSALDKNGMSHISRALVLGQEWLGENHEVLQCLKLGVAIHHGKLPASFRKELESLLRAGTLKITIASPTLAQGLNLTATSVVMYEIIQRRENKWVLIDSSDFRNVIGRAGRAYVDVEGLVLFPTFDKHNYRRGQWHMLTSSTEGYNITSGMVQLVIYLLIELYSILKCSEMEDMAEYIVNKRDFWGTIEPENDMVDGWQYNLSMLDTTILSLIGDEDVNTEQIADVLDKVLHSSLWEKSVAVKEKHVHDLLRKTVISRARFIWNNTNKVQRTKYFLAGVGYAAGQQLEAIYDNAIKLLATASHAIYDGMEEQANDSIIAFAEYVFNIEPFIPDTLPDNWKDVLATWLNGEPVINAGSDSNESSDVVQFVEDGITNKLPWSIGAIKAFMLSVKPATTNADDDSFDTSDLIDASGLDIVIRSIESGTLSIQAAILMQAGFPSRIAAIKATNDTQADFDSLKGMHKWLKSKQTQQLSQNPAWPTNDSHQLWHEFASRSLSPTHQAWDIRRKELVAIWDDQIEAPDPGTIVRLYFDGGKRPIIMSPSFERLGEVEVNFINTPKGVFKKVTVSKNSRFLKCLYIGPDDI